jgi:NitT/TauT family transport system substrate-binding protein
MTGKSLDVAMKFGSRLLVGALLVSAFSPTAGPAQEPVALTIAGSTFDASTTAYYATKAGLFKKAGLNVTFTPMNPSAILPAVASGAVQIGGSNLLNVIEAHSRGIPFTIVAPSAEFNEKDVPGLQGILVAGDSKIASGKDLLGKTVAIASINDLNTISARAWIDRTGGDSSQVKFLELPPASSAAAVAQGRADATILSTPFIAQATDSGLRIVSETYSSISKDFLGLGWITTTDWAAKHPDVIEKFARVMRDAAIYCNSHQNETATIMAELAQQTPEAIRRQKRVLFPQYVDPVQVQPLIDIAARYKFINATFPAQDMISSMALKPGR